MRVDFGVRAVGALAVVLAVSATARAGLAEYVVVPLPVDTAQAGKMNDAGRFIYRADDGPAAIWERGVVVPIAPAGSTFLPFVINDADRVAGAFADVSDGLEHLRLHPASWTLAGGLKSHPGTVSGLPLGINDAGVFVGGAAFTEPRTTFEAFTHDAAGYHRLGFAGSDNASAAFAINAGGTVVGLSGVADGVGQGLGDSVKTSRATVWHDGVVSVVGGLPGDANSVALGVNASGDVIGASSNAAGGLALLNTGPTRAFVVRNGTKSGIGSLGGTVTTPVSLNDAGQVVGNASTAASASHGFVYQAGQIRDLNDLVGSTGNVSITGAVSINKDGVIVADTLGTGVQGSALLYPTALYGSNERYPVLSDLPNFGRPNNDVFNAAVSGHWFVQPTAPEIAYQSNETDLINAVTLPTLGFSHAITIETADGVLGSFAPGSTIDFVDLLGHGVEVFAVENIVGDPNVIDGRAFAVQLEFSVPQTSFFVASRAPVGVPLPAAALAFPPTAVLVLWAMKRARRRGR